MQILVEPRNPTSGIAAVALAFRAGVRYESPRACGVTHLLEHLLLRRTTCYASVPAELDRLSAVCNAATYRDAVVVHGICPSQHYVALAQLFWHMAFEPAFTAGDVELERAAVLAELSDSEDEGVILDPEEILALHQWRSQPMRRPVGGTLSSIRRIQRATLYRAAEQLLVPDEARMVVMGDLGDPPATDEALRYSISRASAPAAQERRPLRTYRCPLLYQKNDGDATAAMHVTWLLPRDEAAALYWPWALTTGYTARLRKAIVEDRGLAYLLGADTQVFEDAIQLSVGVQAYPQHLPEIARHVLQSVSTAVAGDELRLARARNDVCRAEVSLDETCQARALELVHGALPALGDDFHIATVTAMPNVAIVGDVSAATLNSIAAVFDRDVLSEAGKL